MEYFKALLVEYLIPVVAVAFVLFVFLVIINRYLFEESKHRIEEIKMRASELITNLLFARSDTDFEKEIKEIKSEIPYKKKWVKEILLETMIHYKRNLKGSKAEILDKLYKKLELNKVSQKLIRSNKWFDKAKGIYHFQVFNFKEGVETIRPLLYHANEKLRSDAFVAFLSLTNENLDFLAKYEKRINMIDELKIVDLIKAKHFALPSNIEQWLDSDNPTIIRIGLKMMAFNNYGKSHNQIIGLLNNPERSIRFEAINAVKQLLINNAEDVLIDMYHREQKLNKMAILEALSEIGTKTTLDFVTDFLKQNHIADPDEKIKLVYCLNKLDTTFFQTNFANDSEMNLIRKHVANMS